MPKAKTVPPDLAADQHVGEDIAALIAGMSVSWLRNQRYWESHPKFRAQNWTSGPPFVKVGKSVRYRVGALREWLKRRESIQEAK